MILKLLSGLELTSRILFMAAVVVAAGAIAVMFLVGAFKEGMVLPWWATLGITAYWTLHRMLWRSGEPWELRDSCEGFILEVLWFALIIRWFISH